MAEYAGRPQRLPSVVIAAGAVWLITSFAAMIWFAVAFGIESDRLKSVTAIDRLDVWVMALLTLPGSLALLWMGSRAIVGGVTSIGGYGSFAVAAGLLSIATSAARYHAGGAQTGQMMAVYGTVLALSGSLALSGRKQYAAWRAERTHLYTSCAPVSEWLPCYRCRRQTPSHLLLPLSTFARMLVPKLRGSRTHPSFQGQYCAECRTGLNLMLGFLAVVILGGLAAAGLSRVFQ